jgi:hypothetical protein
MALFQQSVLSKYIQSFDKKVIENKWNDFTAIFHNLEKQIIFYPTENSNVNINVTYHNESFWLTQKNIAQLFGVEVPAISKHLANIYESNELQKEATTSILETVQNEGSRKVKRKVEFYNLDAIIAVGYRVNSKQATQFRIWES